MDSKEFKVWNDEMCKKYNPYLFHNNSNFMIKYIENKRTEYIIKYINSKKNNRILEIGCGAGNIIGNVKKGKLFGIDLSVFILRIAKNKIKNNIFLLNSFAEDIPFKKNSFDKIICSEVLEHVLKPEDVLKETYRLLAENGRLVISIPNETLINKIKNIFIKTGFFKVINLFNKYKISEKMDDEWHLHIFHKREFIKILNKSFDVIKIKSIPFMFIPLREVYVCQKKQK